RLYTILADGARELERESRAIGFRDVALDPTGRRIAFVRDTRPEDSAAVPPVPQLFVASLDAPDAATPITDLSGDTPSGPPWSADGTRIAFASDDDGDLDIYGVPVTGGVPERRTSYNGVDTGPGWSPDGALIAFTS